MMRLAETGRFSGTVDPDGHSPVADAAALAWGFTPGTANHWRSSASHVFLVRHANVYLRLIPAEHRTFDEVVAIALLMRHLNERGVPVAQPLPTASGALVATAGDYHAMVVRAAPGQQLDVAALTLDEAVQWGRALARLHNAGADLGVTLRPPFPELHHVADVFPDDAQLLQAAESIRRRLADLPRDADQFGVVHGDFELDNLCWDGEVVTAFDFDEASRSWYVADIACAVRDLAEAPALQEAFVAGYRERHPLPEPDLILLPLFTAAQVVCSAVRIQAAIDAGRPDDPPWLVALRDKLGRWVRRQRNAVRDFAQG